MHLKNQIRVEYTVMRWHHFKQKPLLNGHKIFVTIQGLLNLQRHWIRNDQSRNDYRGVSISAGGKIKSREKIILKIFFVNLSLLLECTYFMDQTNYGWTSREQSNFRLNFETFRWVLWAMLFLLFFSFLPWKLKACETVFCTDRLRISIIRLSFITRGAEKGQQCCSSNSLCSLKISADFHSKLLLCRLYRSTKGISLGILFPISQQQHLFYCNSTFFE